MVAAVEETVSIRVDDDNATWWEPSRPARYILTVSPHGNNEVYLTFSSTHHSTGIFIPIEAAEFIGQRAAEIRASQGVNE